MVSTLVKVSLPLANTVNNDVYNQHELLKAITPCRKHHHPRQPAFAGPEYELISRPVYSPVGRAF